MSAIIGGASMAMTLDHEMTIKKLINLRTIRKHKYNDGAKRH